MNKVVHARTDKPGNSGGSMAKTGRDLSMGLSLGGRTGGLFTDLKEMT
jgi:hypothetical protein